LQRICLSVHKSKLIKLEINIHNSAKFKTQPWLKIIMQAYDSN